MIINTSKNKAIGLATAILLEEAVCNISNSSDYFCVQRRKIVKHSHFVHPDDGSDTTVQMVQFGFFFFKSWKQKI